MLMMRIVRLCRSHISYILENQQITFHFQDSNEENFLVNRHGFHITLIEQTILIQKFIYRLIYHLIRNVRTCFVPDEPSQMLDERREVL